MAQRPGDLRISKKAFTSAFAVLGTLLLCAGILTRMVPAGAYTRAPGGGVQVLAPDSFHYVTSAPYPIWRWFSAPIEVLRGPDRVTIIAISLFLLVIGGAFAVLAEGQVLRHVIARIAGTFRTRKYLLLGVFVLFFMSLGAILGVFEEVIPMVPILIGLAYSLGWDSLTGLGMSVLSAGFGFSAAISNPFSVGIAQKIAGLPLFSGALFRGAVFAAIYLLLFTFLVRHARKVERDPKASPVYAADLAARAAADAAPPAAATLPVGMAQSRAVSCFGGFLAASFVVMITSPLVPGLSDFSLPIIALLFLVGSILSAGVAGVRPAAIVRAFAGGVGALAPAVPLILLAMSIKQIITGGGIMDTLLYRAASLVAGTTPYGAIFVVYALILGMEFFVAASSAKAFLVMPLIAPLAGLVGLTAQSAVLAYAFADGFSNVLYPTNPALLISLGMSVVSFPVWLRWTLKLQLMAFIVTSFFMCLAVAIHLGPF